MPLKFNAVATKSHVLVNLVWSTIDAYFRSRMQGVQRRRESHSNMNDHALRDLGLDVEEIDCYVPILAALRPARKI